MVWIVNYKPPNKPKQIFYFTIEKCPDKKYLAIEINKLKKKYNLIDKYIELEISNDFNT